MNYREQKALFKSMLIDELENLKFHYHWLSVDRELYALIEKLYIELTKLKYDDDEKFNIKENEFEKILNFKSFPTADMIRDKIAKETFLAILLGGIIAIIIGIFIK